MAAKFTFFNKSTYSYIDCIPASGERKRLNWCQKREERRRKTILKLKQSCRHWKNTCLRIKPEWKELKTRMDITFEKQLSNIRESELGMYTSLECKWINKSYRTVSMRTKKADLSAIMIDSHENESYDLFLTA